MSWVLGSWTTYLAESSLGRNSNVLAGAVERCYYGSSGQVLRMGWLERYIRAFLARLSGGNPIVSVL